MANLMDERMQPAFHQAQLVEKALRLYTADIRAHERHDWLEEMICKEFARVKVTPPSQQLLFNETLMYEWDALRLSVIRSNGLTLERLPKDPYQNSQDNYLAVILLSGSYLMEQGGREVFLQPGDITIYDATRLHRVYSSTGFSKLIVTIPRKMMQDSVAGIEHCTALKVSGKTGMGAVATSFIQSVAKQVETIPNDTFSSLSQHSLDLLALAFTSVRPQTVNLSCSRSVSLRLVKDFIERNLADSQLDTAMIAAGTRLSPRYLNALFKEENTSLMRYVWQQRLERCKRDILNVSGDKLYDGLRISDVAYRWGFNDMSHFSRAFKLQFDISPKDLKRS